MTKIAVSALICFAFWKAGHDDVLAFTASSTVTRQAPFTSTSVLDAMPKKSGRRAFLDGAAVATSALMLPLIAVSQPARAADADAGDDLSMPSEEEIKKSDVSSFFFVAVSVPSDVAINRTISPFSTMQRGRLYIFYVPSRAYILFAPCTHICKGGNTTWGCLKRQTTPHQVC